MADARSKKVFSVLAPLYEEANYAIDIAATSMREPLGMSDQIDIPDISELTVTASGASTTSPQAVTTNALALNANLEPFINAKLPQLASMQLLDQKWATQVSVQSVSMLKNAMDSDFCKYLIERNNTAANHVNAAGASLTADHVLGAAATLMDNKGVDESDLVWMMSSWGRASLSNVAGFVPNMTDAGGKVNGLPVVGSLYGIPVYSTSAVPNGRTLASSAFADDGTDMVITVASGHGFVVDQKITFATVTSANDIATASSITATTATSITVVSVTTASATEAGVVTLSSSENLLISKSNTFIAQQGIPSSRIVPLSDSTGSALQISAIWGRVARAGRAVVLGSPKSSI